MTFFESGTLVLTAAGGTELFVEYNINDNGWETAEIHEYEEITVSVNNGDIIKFRGDNNSYCGWETDSETGERYAVDNRFFATDALFSVEGNIMSLISSNDYEHINSLSEEYNNGAFYGIFEDNSKLISAENLILPATTLTSNCYSSMFGGCTSLTTAPELPATTLASSCYQNMFYGCTSLNYIKCLATDISASNCTINWVRGVASTGTFVKPSATDWSTGYNGIPEGWTVEDAA